MNYTALRSSEKKVLAHYFGPYPRSWSNETVSTQAYKNVYNNPLYTSSGDDQMGGMFRDRPLARPQLSGDWLYQDSQWDIEQAMAAGIDGWMCDLLGTSGSNHDRYMKMVEVAHDLNNGFKVVPMIDMNGNTRAASPAVAADAVRKYYLTGGAGSTPRRGAWRLPDGRYVLSAFKGEGPNPINVSTQAAWLQSLFDELQNTWGIQVAYMPCYLNYNYASDPAFTALQWGSGSWGFGADPAVISVALPTKPQPLVVAAKRRLYRYALRMFAMATADLNMTKRSIPVLNAQPGQKQSMKMPTLCNLSPITTSRRRQLLLRLPMGGAFLI